MEDSSLKAVNSSRKWSKAGRPIMLTILFALLAHLVAVSAFTLGLPTWFAIISSTLCVLSLCVSAHFALELVE